MENFEHYLPTKFYFGKDSEKNIGAYVKAAGGTKVMIVSYGGVYPSEIALLETVRKSLKEQGIGYLEVGGVEPNPKLQLCLDAAETVKKENIDLILAVVGGSVIDTAKCIAVSAVYEGDVWEDLYVNWGENPQPLPVGVILTIAATGSESSAGSVITDEKTKLKRFIYDDKNRPTFAVMNPELTYSVPPYPTACGIADIIVHAHERYFTERHDNYLTDMLNESVIKTVIRYGPIVMKDPENYEARAHLMWAGRLAHNNEFGVGRVLDNAVHSIQGEIGGLYDSAHGAGVGLLTIGWMKYVYKKDIPRFVRYFTNVWGVENDTFDPERTILAGIQKVENFMNEIGIPKYLEDLGYQEKDLDLIVERIPRDIGDLCGNFSKLNDEDIKAVIRLCSKGGA